MKKAVTLAVGTISVLAAIFGRQIGGLHPGAVFRACLLVVGLAMLLLALNAWLGTRVRKSLTDKRQLLSAWLRNVAFVLAAALVLFAYVFFISLGKWSNWPSTTDYYDRLASAFRSDHLYVKEAPDPALLALPDPYDPEVRQGIPGLMADVPGTIWDMSLYNGRVYLYWGPAPALLLLAIQSIFPVHIGDQYLTFAFLAGSFVFQVLILLWMWRRFFADVPSWMVMAGMLLVGLANPVPWLLFSPRIYESAIAAGQCFLIGGLCFTLDGFGKIQPSRWRIALAAMFWVCAVASRATLAVAVAFLSLMVISWILWVQRSQKAPGAARVPVACFGIPLLVGGGLLAWYNLARFGSIFEFGFRYAITMLDQNKYHNVLFSTSYLAPNAFLYLLGQPTLENLFPFVKPVWNGAYIAAFNNRFHSIYNTEQMIGVIYAAPFFVLALVPPVSEATAWLRSLRGKATLDRALSLPFDQPLFRCSVLTLSGLALCQLVVVFLVYYGTMRYFLDATPALAILSIIGFWMGYSRLQASPSWRALFVLLAVALLLLSLVTGILVGFSSDIPRLRAANPWLLPHARLLFTSLARQLGRLLPAVAK